MAWWGCLIPYKSTTGQALFRLTSYRLSGVCNGFAQYAIG